MIKPAITLAFAVLLLGGCKTHLSPSTVPHYGFTETKQFHANATVGFNGIEAQMAVSTTDNIYVSAYYQGVKYSQTSRFRMYGLGGGLYSPINKRGRFSTGIELFYGNVGLRNITNPNYNRDQVFRFLANMSLGTEFKLFEFYTGMRMGNYSYWRMPNAREMAFRFEPNATLKIGLGKCKMFGQVGLSIPTSGWNDLIPMAQLGIQIETFKKPSKNRE
ncbi:MAG: hypothetical protein KDC92_02670 [Bacteroidetes bacterium]|nr:hypothetical protein [Bacteroidota bacterium]